MSSTNSRRRQKNRAGTRFAAFPAVCQASPAYIALSLPGKALLHELNGQYDGHNNGDLCAAWGLLKAKGLGSRTTIDKSRDELERSGWVIQTRQGGRNSPNLYALTFREIDGCKGKLDAGVPIGKRLDYWKTASNPMLSSRLRTKHEAAA